MQKNLWWLQHKVQSLLPNDPVASCMRKIEQRLNYEDVHVKYLSEEKLAYYGHLKICGSVWHCPICASIIMRYRQDELTDALAYWNKNGGRIFMATFAVSHEKGKALTTLLHPLEVAMKHLRQGRSAQKMKEEFGVLGTISIRGLSYTEHGWCPCIYQMIFFEKESTKFLHRGNISLEYWNDFDRDNYPWYEHVLKNRWQQVIQLEGSIDNQFSLTLEKDFNKIYNYAAQFGSELLAPQSVSLDNSIPYNAQTSELNPFAILDLAARGDHECEALFQEYARCYKGKRLVAWSKDLRATLSAGLFEYFKGKADYEVVYETINELSRVITILTQEQWSSILAREMRGELMEVAKSGSWTAIAHFLGSFNDETSI